MSFELFYKVPAGAIETLFDEQKQPQFKRADWGRYLQSYAKYLEEAREIQ